MTTTDICYIMNNEGGFLFYGLLIFCLGIGFGLILKIFYDYSLRGGMENV